MYENNQTDNTRSAIIQAQSAVKYNQIKLANDLWRMRTGKATAEYPGLV